MSREIQVKALVRGDKQAERAAGAVRRLIGVVSEWEDGAGIDLTISSGERRGRVDVRIRQQGVVHSDWLSDLEWVLRGVAELRRVDPEPRPRTYDEVVELRAARDLVRRVIDDDGYRDPHTALAERRLDVRATVPWPAARFNSALGLVEFLAETPGFAARFRVASASPIERTIVTDTMRETWTGADEDLAAYIGRPVRLRSLLAS